MRFMSLCRSFSGHVELCCGYGAGRPHCGCPPSALEIPEGEALQQGKEHHAQQKRGKTSRAAGSCPKLIIHLLPLQGSKYKTLTVCHVPPAPHTLCWGLSQHQGNHSSIPNPVPSIPNPGSWAGGLPTALHSPPRSLGSYHDSLVQRDSLMKWKRRRRSKLNGLS